MLDYVFFTIYYSFNMAGVVQGHWTFDYIREILARLSLKSLTRCKSLSKQWKLEISSDKFIRFRNQLNKGTEEHKDLLCEDLDGDSPQFVIFRIDRTSFDGLDLEVNIHPIKEIKIPPSTLAAIDHAQVLENCRGILCYFIENLGFYQYIGIGDYIQNGNYSFVVCNPLTTECKIFSRPNQIGWKGFGFGYDYSADDYKVIYATGSPRVGKFGTKVECLSLKTGVWNTARIDIHYYFSFESQAHAHHVNGCLYWIAQNYEEDYGGNVILCLDLEKEVMSEVTSLRVDEVLNKWSSCYLDLLEGSLCLISYHDVVYPFDVWMMKEDPMTTTKYWIKFMTIPPTFSVTPKLLCFIKNGVLYMVSGQDSEEFFLYNPVGESVKKIVARGLDFDRYSCSFIPYN